MTRSILVDEVLCRFLQGNLLRVGHEMEVFDLERWNVIV
jgi:hypothetical protein